MKFPDLGAGWATQLNVGILLQIGMKIQSMMKKHQGFWGSQSLLSLLLYPKVL